MQINKSEIIAWAGWIVLIAIILFKFKCGSGSVPTAGAPFSSPAEITTTAKTRTILIHDTVTRRILVPLIQQLPAETIFVAIPAHIDTAEILKDYYAKYYYSDKISDSLLEATITDTISTNTIISRAFTYKLLRPQTIQNITSTQEITPERYRFYFGFGISLNQRLLAGIGPELLMTAPKQMAFGLGYELLSQSLGLRVYRKIGNK